MFRRGNSSVSPPREALSPRVVAPRSNRSRLLWPRVIDRACPSSTRSSTVRSGRPCAVSVRSTAPPRGRPASADSGARLSADSAASSVSKGLSPVIASPRALPVRRSPRAAAPRRKSSTVTVSPARDTRAARSTTPASKGSTLANPVRSDRALSVRSPSSSLRSSRASPVNVRSTSPAKGRPANVENRARSSTATVVTVLMRGSRCGPDPDPDRPVIVPLLSISAPTPLACAS